MGAVWYATREALKSSLDVAETARTDALIDRALGYATTAVEGYLHRRFYPFAGTRTFDFPRPQDRSPSWRFDLHEDEAAFVSAVAADGTPIDPADYTLSPANGPAPYTAIELFRDRSGSFVSGQRELAVTGIFAGCPIDERTIGALSGSVTDSAGALVLQNGSGLGVGSILRIGSEYLIVTGRSWADSTVNTAGALAANKGVTAVPVGSAASFAVGEVVYVDAEQMLVVDVVGSNLIVRRAWNGSVLAAHNSGADVFVSRTFAVDRGQLGSTAAAHSDGAAVLLWVVPALASALCLAEAVMYLQNEGSGWARVVGSGDGTRESSGRALKDLREQAWTALARKVRGGAV
jgi:hypothetical protein